MNNNLLNKTGGRRPAVFFDRDGTLIDDIGYLSDPGKVFFYNGVPEALKKLVDRGYLLVVITNQSGIGRGYFEEETAIAVNLSLLNLLEEKGVGLSAVYYCPHHPDERCLCRKPGVLMLKRAIDELGIDCSSSWVVGDTDKDVHAGMNAGLRAILVETGKPEKGDLPADVMRSRSIADAVIRILDQETG